MGGKDQHKKSKKNKKEEEESIGTLQLRQEELQSLMQKDQPEKLGEKVQSLVKKLKFVRTYKEQELKEKRLKEMAKQEILMMEKHGAINGVP